MSPVVIDALSGREITAGPEELNATQPLIYYLTQKLGWHPNQLMAHPQWRVPKSPSAARSQGFPVDLAIFDSPTTRGNPDHVRIIAECKAPDEDKGIGQLKIYLSLEPEARVGIWFNGQSHALVYKLRDGFTVNRYARIPTPADPLSPSAAQEPLRFADLVPPPNLGETFSRLRDHIAAQDSHVNRDEFILNDLANLLVCKIADEQAGEMDPDRAMAFQLSGGTRQATGDAIRAFFDETKGRLRSVFTDGSDRLHVDDASLETIVKNLQSYRLLGHDRHAVGTAFQRLRGRALKGEEGAYFTPPPLVDCVVSVLDPGHTDRVIDPACGTGGFLAATLDHVYERVDQKQRVKENAKTRTKRDWAKDSLFAVDKDAVSIRLCKAYLTLLGDGRSHAYRANTIDRGEWDKRSDDLAGVVADGSFDVGMTNPPFGKKLKVSADVGQQEGLLTCRTWRHEGDEWRPTDRWREQQLGVVFLERCLGLLKPGGRLAIVLPETFLFSKGFRWLVDWICRSWTVTHVMDVPMVAFEEFCRAKTCVLFIMKQKPSQGHQIIMSFPRTIGQDGDGKPLRQRSERGERTGELDNEMADAVQEISSFSYDADRPKLPGRARGATRFCFRVQQSQVRRHGVLVPRYWWRADTEKGLRAWAKKHPADIVTLGELADRGIIAAFDGHGSPSKTARGTGDVPYVKVTDLKNWRINENPTNFIHREIAARLRRHGPDLRFGDLVTPSRASSNIGQFCLVLPWQTHVVLTKEILVLRVLDNDRGIDPFLLLSLLSLRVVLTQYETLALMQVNREHLGEAWREVRVPLPDTEPARRQASQPIKRYFEAIVQARSSYNALMDVFDPSDFGTRP